MSLVMPGWRSKRFYLRANGITLPICYRPSRIDQVGLLVSDALQPRPLTRKGLNLLVNDLGAETAAEPPLGRTLSHDYCT